MQLDSQEIVFIEDESLSIGKVFIPHSFFDQMASARFMKLLVPLNRRVHHLVESYTGGDPEALILGIKRIEKRLGLANAASIINCINNGELEKAVEMVLLYYDKVYTRSMGLHKRKEIAEIAITHENANEVAEQILELSKTSYT